MRLTDEIMKEEIFKKAIMKAELDRYFGSNLKIKDLDKMHSIFDKYLRIEFVDKQSIPFYPDSMIYIKEALYAKFYFDLPYLEGNAYLPYYEDITSQIEALFKFSMKINFVDRHLIYREPDFIDERRVIEVSVEKFPEKGKLFVRFNGKMLILFLEFCFRII